MHRQTQGVAVAHSETLGVALFQRARIGLLGLQRGKPRQRFVLGPGRRRGGAKDTKNEVQLLELRLAREQGLPQNELR
jgi:hypothetical protein